MLQIDALGEKPEDPNEAEFWERKYINSLRVLDPVGFSIAKKLPTTNAFVVMTKAGSEAKGDLFNISQIEAFIGQQMYEGQRPRLLITGGTRFLPYFDINDNSLEARGFIPESFLDGVDPAGFFFLLYAAREGIMDTSLKTQDTGSMEHKMMKAAEDVKMGYDGSVHNTVGTRFCFTYNSGFDIKEMVEVSNPEVSGKFTSFCDISKLAEEINAEEGWIRKDKFDELKTLPEVPSETKKVAKKTKKAKIQLEENETRQWEKINRFERCRILGTRAIQLSNGDEPKLHVDKNEMNFLKIAMIEYNAGLIKIGVSRTIPGKKPKIVYPTLENIDPLPIEEYLGEIQKYTGI